MRAFRIALIGAVCCVLAISGWNYWSLYRHAQHVVAKYGGDDKLTVWAYHRYMLLPGTVVFDLRTVSMESSAADVDRVMLRFAEALKDRPFDRVLLAYKGTPKFQFKGDYFQGLGQDFQTQNPIYTLRTMPENVFKMDGSQAFGTWSGGWIGVLGKQMQDVSSFHAQWFMNEVLKAKN